MPKAIAEYRKLKRLHGQLINATINKFPVKGKSINVSGNQGVYVIYSPTDCVLHVGTTKRAKGGLNQRLNNHRNGASSFSINYLMPQNLILSNGYYFRYLEVHDPRERVLLEALTIGLLCPEHIGTGAN